VLCVSKVDIPHAQHFFLTHLTRAAHIQTPILYSPRAPLTVESVRRYHKSSHLKLGAAASATSQAVRSPAPPLPCQHRPRSRTPSRCPRLSLLPQNCEGDNAPPQIPISTGAPGHRSSSWRSPGTSTMARPPPPPAGLRTFVPQQRLFLCLVG
jgi:hypothetical protein